MKKIIVYMKNPHVDAWNFKAAHGDLLEALVPGLQVVRCLNSRGFKDRLPGAEAVIVWFFKNEWLARAPKLRLIATPAAGVDWIEPDPTETLRISHGGFHGPMIAESVVGAAFYFLKAFPLSMEMQKRKKWARVKIAERLGSLYKKRVTILGFGRIGETVGRALKGFGCALTGIKREPAKAPDYFDAGDRIVTVDRMEEVLPATDHMILILPGGGGTEGCFKREHFALLPKTCYFYNVGRGNAYKEEDIVWALREGKLAGVYLDVFETEPLAPESELWEMENVLIQPHLSAASPQYLELFVRELAGKINDGLLMEERGE